MFDNTSYFYFRLDPYPAHTASCLAGGRASVPQAYSNVAPWGSPAAAPSPRAAQSRAAILGEVFQGKLFVLAFCRGGELNYQNIVKLSNSLGASKYQHNGSIDADFCAILQHFSRSTRKCILSYLHISDFAKIDGLSRLRSFRWT